MQGYWEDGHFVLASTARDKIARLEKSEASLADDVARLNSRLATAIQALREIAEHEHQAHGECVAYLSDETLRFANYDIRKFAYLCAKEGHRCCAAIAAATIARVEGN